MAHLRRLFVAVDLPGEIRHRLAALLQREVADLPGAVVAPHNWHITLRFVGSASELGEDRLRYELSNLDAPGPFTIRLGGFGAFPRASKASVLWLGVERGVESLGELAQAVETCTQAAGFEPEDRPFRPHLTISRLRPTADVRDVAGTGFDAGIDLPVTSVTLFASTLRRGGARYDVVDRFAL